MTTALTASATFVPCPACSAPAGRPVSVATKGPTNVEVTFRCAACQTEWTEDRVSPGLSLRKRSH